MSSPSPSSRPVVAIKSSQSSHDCECCGSFSTESAAVLIDGNEVLFAEFDGHLGGGNWDGQRDTLLLWVLQALGYQVRISASPLLSSKSWLPYGKPCYDGIDEIVLFPKGAPEHSLDISLGVGRAELHAAPGVPAKTWRCVLDADGCPTEAGWGGELAEVLEYALECLAEVRECGELHGSEAGDGALAEASPEELVSQV